jgi:hypothetical protein
LSYTHLKIIFHRNQAAGWSPTMPSMRLRHTAQSNWRNSIMFYDELILQMLCQYKALLGM